MQSLQALSQTDRSASCAMTTGSLAQTDQHVRFKFTRFSMAFVWMVEPRAPFLPVLASHQTYSFNVYINIHTAFFEEDGHRELP